MPQITTITYTNESDNTDSTFLAYSRPPVASIDAAASAWQVIEHIGPGGSHVFRYTVASQLQVLWNGGASTSNRVDAMPGDGFQFTTIGNAYELVRDPNLQVPPNQIAALDSLAEPIVVQLLKDDHVWAASPPITRGMQVQFEFEPRIFVGFGMRPRTAPALEFAVMSSDWTEISLLGIASLTIAATGDAASGYQFIVRDVVEEA
jgi:hypothetical protein